MCYPIQRAKTHSRPAITHYMAEGHLQGCVTTVRTDIRKGSRASPLDVCFCQRSPRVRVNLYDTAIERSMEQIVCLKTGLGSLAPGWPSSVTCRSGTCPPLCCPSGPAVMLFVLVVWPSSSQRSHAPLWSSQPADHVRPNVSAWSCSMHQLSSASRALVK